MKEIILDGDPFCKYRDWTIIVLTNRLGMTFGKQQSLEFAGQYPVHLIRTLAVDSHLFSR